MISVRFPDRQVLFTWLSLQGPGACRVETPVRLLRIFAIAGFTYDLRLELDGFSPQSARAGFSRGFLIIANPAQGQRADKMRYKHTIRDCHHSRAGRNPLHDLPRALQHYRRSRSGLARQPREGGNPQFPRIEVTGQ